MLKKDSVILADADVISHFISGNQISITMKVQSMIVNPDVMMSRRKMSLNEPSEQVGLND